jgi:hypothetical protein
MARAKVNEQNDRAKLCQHKQALFSQNTAAKKISKALAKANDELEEVFEAHPLEELDGVKLL